MLNAVKIVLWDTGSEKLEMAFGILHVDRFVDKTDVTKYFGVRHTCIPKVTMHHIQLDLAPWPYWMHDIITVTCEQRLTGATD